MRLLTDARTQHSSGVALVLILLASGVAGAQSAGGAYALDPQRIAGGGGRSGGGVFEITGTIGQPEASAVRSGGVFELTGGFHRRAADAPQEPEIFHNGFEEQ